MKLILVVLLWFSVVAIGTGLPRSKTSSGLNIIGGNVTDITKVPYQAALITGDDRIICGASIISENYLLTACQCCVSSPEAYGDEVRVGSNRYDSGGRLLKILFVFPHPKCSILPDGAIYDVCILQTSSPIEFNEKVKPVPISKEVPRPGDLTLVAGWGLTSEDGSTSSELESVYVPVTNKTYCRKAYPGIPHFDTVICAGEEGKDSCSGDNGGGLVWNNSLVGVVSFRDGCAEKGYPGVYSNILQPEIRSFIKYVADV